MLSRICAGALAGLLLVACSADKETDIAAAGVDLTQVLGGVPDAGFARATEPRQFVFPRDHGMHPAFQTEWWYFTGHLNGGARSFGYQLTFFRQATRPQAPTSSNPWATQQLFMAHFALTDVGNQQFAASQRLARARPGLAQAAPDALAVRVEDWSATADGSALALRASDGAVGIDLTVDLSGPLLRHGDEGLSRKSAQSGNASYYYSMPRLPTSGTVRGPFGAQAVTGSSWLDREWSTSVLAADQVGWDWFSINLGPDIDLMLFQLRDSRGASHAYSAGTLRQGAVQTALGNGDFALTPLARWRSPHSGVQYPTRWRIQIPGVGMDLEISPLLADQELNLGFRYWEGAIGASGTLQAAPLTGLGYLEMTGYETSGSN